MSSSRDTRLGTLLVNAGVLSERQLQHALEIHASSGRRLGRVLVGLGYATQAEILSALAQQMGVPHVELQDLTPDPAAVGLVPQDMARRYTLLPLEQVDGSLVVAMADPQNVLAIDDVRMVTGRRIRPVMASREELLAAIEDNYAVVDIVDMDLFNEIADIEALTEEEMGEATEDAPTVKLVNYVINRAITDRASDIHIEPQERDLRIRYRIDGVLHEMMRSPKASQPAIISRFKVMADMDIAESRKPQDGHMQLKAAGHQLDFRVSTLPTVYGERVVLRILRKDNIMLGLEDLGFLPGTLERFESSFRKPYGAVLVTGPTGSGKSTSLYAAINAVNDMAKHILTAEDPVEYRLAGVNQVQTNAKIGLTFARLLRSFLRSSPDIILVGEIRDQETARIAIESALTGHLVLSTLHTNNAPGAITRLVEMGVEPFLVASAVDCVVAQRLARRLCPECKEAYEPQRQALRDAGYAPDAMPEMLWRAVGCKRCGGTGYRGRTGIHEVMLISEEIRDLTVTGATSEAILKVAVSQGMLTLRQDGLEKARSGLTSLEEVARVVS